MAQPEVEEVESVGVHTVQLDTLRSIALGQGPTLHAFAISQRGVSGGLLPTVPRVTYVLVVHRPGETTSWRYAAPLERCPMGCRSGRDDPGRTCVTICRIWRTL